MKGKKGWDISTETYESLQRNVQKIHHFVTHTVEKAMLSISSFKRHPDFKNTLHIIKTGGKKAKGMMTYQQLTIL